MAHLCQQAPRCERRQIEKLDPQPQPAAALGFSTLNDDPPSESTKSTMQPRTRSMLTGSTTSRSEEHTSELQSLMRISYAVFCLKKKKHHLKYHQHNKPINTNITSLEHTPHHKHIIT